MSAVQNDSLRTRAELSNYEETSRYGEVIQFIEELQRKSTLLRVEIFGHSEEGRALPLMILSNPPLAHPRQAGSGKPVVFVMANIHAGEVEGKEAMLHLSRRLLLGDLQPLLNDLVVLIAPIYNADGNERIATVNRSEQYGPVGGVGTRENARGLDLNRDYMKMDSAEARSLIGLFNRWDPHLTVDLHTTNGSYHGYHLTYSPTLNPSADPRLISFEREEMLPAITRAVREKHGFRMYFYGNFSPIGNLDDELMRFSNPDSEIWRTFDHRPRFGNNYSGLRNRLTILSEAYSYLEFKRRIDVTAAFVEEILRYAASNAERLLSLVRSVDQTTPAELGVSFELKALPDAVDILVGDVEKKVNPRSGLEMTAMLEDKVTPVRMRDFGLFAATRSVPVPKAYIFRREPGIRAVLERVLGHGLVVEELASAVSIEVEGFRVDEVQRAPRPFQGHSEVALKGVLEKQTAEFAAGSLVVRIQPPLGALAAYLLDPQSDDGLTTWNFFDAFLATGRMHPVYRLMSEPQFPTRIVKQDQ